MKCCRATQPKVDLEFPDVSLKVELAEDWKSRLVAPGKTEELCGGDEELCGEDELLEVLTTGTRGALVWTL